MAAAPQPAEAAMTACLQRLGFNEPAIAIIRSHGVTDAEAFRVISYPAMSQFTDSIVKAGSYRPHVPQIPVAGRGAGAAAAAAAHALALAAAQPVVLPYTALRGMKALRAWLDFRSVRGEPLDVDLFTDDVKDKWLMRIDVLDDVIKNPPGKDATPPPKLTGWTNWTIWEQQFLTYVSQFRSSMCGAPLTYLLRKDAIPTAETMATE
jgi:hypothetical protein